MQAVAQAQAVKQNEVTKQESLELVKCLLRVSVFHTAYLRALFPENAFKACVAVSACHAHCDSS